jgi:hypothetical protein
MMRALPILFLSGVLCATPLIESEARFEPDLGFEQSAEAEVADIQVGQEPSTSSGVDQFQPGELELVEQAFLADYPTGASLDDFGRIAEAGPLNARLGLSDNYLLIGFGEMLGVGGLYLFLLLTAVAIEQARLRLTRIENGDVVRARGTRL